MNPAQTWNPQQGTHHTQYNFGHQLHPTAHRQYRGLGNFSGAGQLGGLLVAAVPILSGIGWIQLGMRKSVTPMIGYTVGAASLALGGLALLGTAMLGGER
jgi:hypothetical protein